MADRKALRERFEELARCTEQGQYATVSREDVRAVLELIREAEPHLLTLEECRERDRIVTIEYRVLRYGPEGETEMETKFEKTARYIGLVGDSPTFACFKAYMDHFSRPKNEYRRTWRCWSADPGDEVRKETKWDEEDGV